MGASEKRVVRKYVEFYLDNEEDQLAWQYAMGLQNFQGSIKQGFARAQRRKKAAELQNQHHGDPRTGGK